MFPTASELMVVAILRKKSGKGEGVVKIRVVDGSALDKDGKIYRLTRDVVEIDTAHVI